MKLFVGGLSYDVSDDNLREMFAAHGTVESAAVVTDRHSGQPRGFGFVEMPDRSQAQAAITALHGTEYMGRTLEVNEARPPVKRDFGHGLRPNHKRIDSAFQHAGGDDKPTQGNADRRREDEPEQDFQRRYCRMLEQEVPARHHHGEDASGWRH